MHLLQATRPERDQPVVAVYTEVREVLQQPIGKLLIPCGTRAPRLGQHGVVGPVVAHPFLTEHVLVGGAGGVSPPPLLPGELALGVGQLQEHCSCQERRNRVAATGRRGAGGVVPALGWGASVATGLVRGKNPGAWGQASPRAHTPAAGAHLPTFCSECLTCNMDVLRLVLSWKVKSRGRIFILNKPKPKGRTGRHAD